MHIPASAQAVVTTKPIVGNEINVGIMLIRLSMKWEAKLRIFDFILLYHCSELVWSGTQDLTFGIVPV